MSRKSKELAQEIYCDLEHGECLYEQDMLDSLIKKIEELKKSCIKEFKDNQED